MILDGKNAISCDRPPEAWPVGPKPDHADGRTRSQGRSPRKGCFLLRGARAPEAAATRAEILICPVGRRRSQRKLTAGGPHRTRCTVPQGMNVKTEPIRFAALDDWFERDVATATAKVRVILCVLNVVVIWLDRSTPSPGLPRQYFWAILVSLVFLSYAALALFLLNRRDSSARKIAVSTPIIDVLFSFLLIVSTNGHLSPFNLWIIFCVVASGFHRDRRMLFVTAALGALAYVLIALIPQVRPVDQSVVAVRTGYIFGFAAILAVFASFVSAQTKFLTNLQRMGEESGLAASVHEVADAHVAALASLGLPIRIALHVHGGETYSHDSLGDKEPRHRYSYTLSNLTEEIALGEIFTERSLSRLHQTFIRVICDRSNTALARVDAIQQLLEVSRRDERLRFADDLHDGYVQALATIDLRIEALRQTLPKGDDAAIPDIHAIKKVLRDAASSVRKLIEPMGLEAESGPERVLASLKERWDGELNVQIDPDVELTAAQWQAVEMIAKEGAHNARKHGRAARLDVRIEHAPNATITASIADNGAEQLGQTTYGYGLTRLETVVRQLGGRLRLEQNEPSGARLVVEFKI